MELTQLQVSPVRRQSSAVSELNASMSSPLETRSSATLPHQRPSAEAPVTPSCSMCALFQESLRAGQIQNERLTRSLSHVLAKLKSAKDLTREVERSMEKRAMYSPRRTPEPCTLSPTLSPTKMNSSDGSDGLLNSNLTDNMYPVLDGGLVPDLSKYMSEVHSLLRDASEVCLSSAGSSFSASVTLRRACRTSETSSSSFRSKPKLTRMNTLPSMASSLTSSAFFPTTTEAPSSLSAYGLEIGSAMGESGGDTPTNRPTHIHSLMGSSSRISLRRSRSETLLNSPEVDYEVGMMDLGLESPAPLSPSTEPFRSHLLSLLNKQHPAAELLTSESTFSLPRPPPETPTDSQREFVRPLGNGLSGEDSKQLLEKIAQMENERLKLMTQIDRIKEENAALWESLSELATDLDSKSLHLQLVLQDLLVATTEIKMAAEIKQSLNNLIKERDGLKLKLANLEDESSAVKESLVQLLQEKSATNRTLTLENQRLRTKIVKLRSSSTPASLAHQNSFPNEQIDATDGIEDDIISTDDGGEYIHRQGFLVKQGGKFKNWRKRLFVLNNSNLSYFKTEEAVGVIPLEAIIKVQVQHGQTIKPNLFEVHTQGGRVYLLSAHTHQEMQHWVGMLQTLMHSRQQTLRRNLHLQQSLSHRLVPEDVARPASYSPGTSQPHQAQYDPSNPPPGYKVVKHRARSSLDSVTSTICLPRVELGSEGSRVRMFSAGRTLPLVVHLDTTDEEDEGERDGRSPFVSSDEEGRTASTKDSHQK